MKSQEAMALYSPSQLPVTTRLGQTQVLRIGHLAKLRPCTVRRYACRAAMYWSTLSSEPFVRSSFHRAFTRAAKTGSWKRRVNHAAVRVCQPSVRSAPS